MAAITASMVAELRGKTDAPMMECKKALTEADGDMVKAEEILRVKLGNKASKAAARIAAEGIVAISISADGKTGAIIEVNASPGLLAHIDGSKLQAANLASRTALEPFQYYTMANHGQWSIVALPTLAWAKKVFPGECDEAALKHLPPEARAAYGRAVWEAVERVSRPD